MIVEGWMVTLSIFILGLIWKAALDHFTIKELVSNSTKDKNKIENIETEQLKIVEALNRTYATEKFVYEIFITRREHGDSMERLEEKLLTEMAHMNETLEKICKIIESK